MYVSGWGQLITLDSGSGIRGPVESLTSTRIKRRRVCLREEQREVDLTESEVPVGHPARGSQGAARQESEAPRGSQDQTQEPENLTHHRGG